MFRFFVVSFLLLFSAHSLYSYRLEDGYQRFERIFVRGVNNFFMSPCEIWIQVNDSYQENGALYALWHGVMKGISKGGARFAWGVLDVIVSPFNFFMDINVDIMDPDTIVFDAV